MIFSSFQSAFAQQTGERPNIILVMADDQGWGQTGYNGHPILKTPHLDAMAESGLRFNRFYAAAPVCSPTRAAVLTGRTNQRTGVETHGYAMHRQEKTIAQALAGIGYATAHFGKWHLNGLRGPGVPILKDDPYGPEPFGFQTWLSVSNFFDRDPIMSRQGVFEEFKGDSSEIIVDEAIKFIEAKAKSKQPSFTVIWYGTPHSPFRASAEDAAPFADLADNSKNQLGELVAMDRSIGTLRKKLVNLGIADNTILWFTSDNGGLPNMKPNTTGGLRGNKGTVYEGGLRVPGIIEWPSKIKPRVTNYPAVSMDILPTLADIVGLESSTWIEPQDGISLKQVFDNELKKREKPIHFHYNGSAAIIDNNIKYLQVVGRRQQRTRYELYDLRVDQKEEKNLISSREELANKMRSMLETYQKSVEQSALGMDFDSKSILKGHRPPTSWTKFEGYQPYLKEWRKRWEYRNTK